MTGLGMTRQQEPDAQPAAPGNARGSLVTGLIVVAALVAYCLRTDNLLYLVGALIFFVGLMVSVVLHEAGHFIMARRYGMKATQFFVGFGPTLFSRQRGETEYGVKAIPAGGFVKIIGMTPLEEVEPGDEKRAFFRFPTRQKTVVLAAGSIMHFLIALLLIFLSVWIVGRPTETSPGIARVQQCIAPDPVIPRGASESEITRILNEAFETDPCTVPGNIPSPALQSGLRAGDVVLAVEGQPIQDRRDLTEALRAAPGTPLSLIVERDGERLALTVTPAPIKRLALDDVFTRVVAGTIGVSVQLRQDTEPQSFLDSFEATGDVLGAQLAGIKRVVTEKLPTITQLYSDDRDPQGFVGVVGVGRISGEILASEETTSFKVFGMLSIVAGLNLFVGIFNLLPLLPLDGGHIAIAWYESLRHKLRRLRGYSGEIRRVDFNKLLPLTYGVAAVFAVFTLVLLGADLFNPIRINS